MRDDAHRQLHEHFERFRDLLFPHNCAERVGSLLVGPKPTARRRRRKPSPASLYMQATKAAAKTGRSVMAMTVGPETVTFTFSEGAGNGDTTNPWDEVLKDAADQKRPS